MEVRSNVMQRILGRRFERKQEQLLPRKQFAKRMIIFAFLGIFIEAVAILIGTLGFHYLEGVSWLDGILNAAMVITGNGPAFEPHTEWAKIFQILFSVCGVIIFVMVMSVIIAPVFHRVLHHFHVAPVDNSSNE